MDWSQVLYAGIGGGVGALLGTLIAFGVNKIFVKNEEFHYMTTAAFAAGLAVLGMNVVPDMYGNRQSSQFGTSMEQTLLDSSPIYPAMKEYEPEYFKKVTNIIGKARQEGKDENEVINLSRVVLMELLEEKMQYADGATLAELMQISRQNYMDFKQNKPFLCVLAINQRGMGDIDPYVSKDSLNLEQVYMLKMVQLPRLKTAPVDKGMAKKSEEFTTLEIVKLFPSGIILDLPENTAEEKLKKVCDVGVALIDVTLALPERERSNYIRSKFKR